MVSKFLKGIDIMMDIPAIHWNQNILKAREFDPERWIAKGGQEKGSKTEKGLERYLMSFSMGHRQCLGLSMS